jgi:pimeloyl-ACP methyl ester carboxylesterase
VDKVCPCVLLHRQGGAFGFKVAEQRPDKIKAIVAVESATAGIVANAAKLKDIPVLMLFGDYVDQHPRWSTFKVIDTEYGNAIKTAGGHGRLDQSPGHRHQGQRLHDDAGQEQHVGR